MSGSPSAVVNTVVSHFDMFSASNNSAVLSASNSSFLKAIAQVKDLGSHLSNAVSGNGHNSIMSRVKSGFLAVAALGPAIGNVAVRAAGKGLDKLVDKHPVLAMAAGIAGLIGGIVLATHEPFTGIALTTAAAYTIVKSYKPVHEKLMKALGKPDGKDTKLPENTDIKGEADKNEGTSIDPPVAASKTPPPSNQDKIDDGKDKKTD